MLFFCPFSRDYSQRWSNIPETEIISDPDWIREREIDREIQARDEQVDRDFRQLQAEKQSVEVVKRGSSAPSGVRQMRSSQHYEQSYTQPTAEGEELPYIVTDEDARLQTMNPQGYGPEGGEGNEPMGKCCKTGMIEKSHFIHFLAFFRFQTQTSRTTLLPIILIWNQETFPQKFPCSLRTRQTSKEK